LACLLGKTKNIFFPKLDETQMMTFSDIAELFLAEIGMEPEYCESDDEAREKAAKWEYGNKKYPVYFFTTNTSGEKQYEEFFTEIDNVNMKKFSALGVIENLEKADKVGVNAILSEFTEMFQNDSVNKAAIVTLLSKHLSDFKHIETGKSLDQKM
jgi:FlaA1/EpsC-like NDP-sugar epimerase